MNFLNATVEGGVLHTAIGDLSLDDRTRQALERHKTPREVIVGLRPEAFEDAALAHDGRWPVVTATVDVLESLGSDVYVYFTAEGGPAQAAELEELATDSGLRDTGAGSVQQIVARLDAATRAREGQPLELRVDMRKAHVFDPATGVNLSHPENAG
jgi:multiple sugar transport system ATP-binding protein